MTKVVKPHVCRHMCMKTYSGQKYFKRPKNSLRLVGRFMYDHCWKIRPPTLPSNRMPEQLKPDRNLNRTQLELEQVEPLISCIATSPSRVSILTLRSNLPFKTCEHGEQQSTVYHLKVNTFPHVPCITTKTIEYLHFLA